MSPSWFALWTHMAIGLLVAMCLSSILRPATARLNQTLGLVWPFSTVHCAIASAPGCEPRPGMPVRLARR